MVGDKRVAFILLLILCSLVVALPNVETVSAAEDSWTTMEPMPTARAWLGVAVVNGKIYAIGGYNYGSGYLGINEEYDPATNTWVTKTSMPTPRDSFGIAVVENKIYVIGGTNGDYMGTDVNEVYDPETDTWVAGPAMPTARYGLGVAVVDDSLYAIGGREGWFGSPISVANERYTPADFVPEFPSWIILPLFLVATFAVMICKKRLAKRLVC